MLFMIVSPSNIIFIFGAIFLKGQFRAGNTIQKFFISAYYFNSKYGYNIRKREIELKVSM